MRLDGKLHRYGVPIMIIPQGTWFWSQLLCDISFVLAGKREAFDSFTLRDRDNSLPYAIHEAARHMTRMIKRGEIQ